LVKAIVLIANQNIRQKAVIRFVLADLSAIVSYVK